MIVELAQALRSRKLSAVELAAESIKKARADQTNSFLTIAEEHANAAARAADVILAKAAKEGATQPPMLCGIPIGVKDNLCTKGIATTCASKILEGYVPPYDATVVQKLKAEGAVIVGKLNLDEFAMGSSNENSAFGPVKNPVNPAFVPGGSSGGSAAAVKAGIVPASLGSDTGGSIRLPAAFTGTVGLKPTYGRVSRFGLVAFASSLDQVGPVTHSVDDAALVFDAIAGHDPHDPTSVRVPSQNSDSAIPKKIGVLKPALLNGLQVDIAKALVTTIDTLQKHGVEIVELDLPQIEHSVAVYYVVAVSEASSNLSRFDGVRFGQRRGGDRSLVEMYSETRALFGEEVKRRILLGTFALSSGYYEAYYRKACQVRRLIAQDFARGFKNCDAILMPVASTTAFRLGEKRSPLELYLNDIFTIPANLAGLPAISVPVGRDQDGMPIGIQFVGRAFDESTIFSLGRFIENEIYREPHAGI